MAAQRDEDRPGRERARTLITACGVLLASSSLAALVLTDDVKRLRLAVVGALWAFLLVAITGRFRARAEEAPSESDEELRRFYQMELQQEVAARREYELRLEVQMRRELEETRTQEIEELRSEVHRLRAELMGIEAPDRAALLAGAAARMSPEQLQSLREEAQRVNGQQRRPVERLQLPAGFSDSPPPVEAPPSYASPSHDTELSQPRLVPPAAGSAPGSEPYSPTEYVPAASHGTRPVPPEPSFAMNGHTPNGHAMNGSTRDEAELPAAYAAPEEFTVVTPYGTPESSGTFGSPVPSPAWSSYTSPPVPPAPVSPVVPGPPVPPAPRTQQVGPAHGTPEGPATYDVPSYDGYSSSPSHPPIQPDTSHPGYPAAHHQPTEPPGAAVEPYGGGRHGSPAEVSRQDPFDPSNTWPGAFKVSNEERTPAAPAPRDSEVQPTPQAGWRPTEQPAEWRPADTSGGRGRHHAGDEPADDVLAQILGRW